MKQTATPLLEWLTETKRRINLLVGGAGSSKSWSIAQHIIQKAYSENRRAILVTRKTLPSLRITAYKLVLELLNSYNLPYDLNRSELIVRTPNGSEMLFKSLDMPEKIKSSEFNYVWVEEATEINLDDFRQLDLRLRRRTDGINQMFLSCNPISKLNWIYTEIVEKQSTDIAVHISTYKDNPFLSQTYIDRLEGLRHQDQNYYKIYALGEWGMLENIIYSNYDLIEELPENADETIYGLDFGFNNPSSMVRIGIKDNEYYVQEVLHKSRLTNTDLIGEIKQIGIDSNPVYSDSAEPARIEEMNKEGLYAYPAEKDVQDGIDYVKRHKLHITKDSVNLLKEIMSYKYREDKDGNVLEEPVKFNDHLCFIAGTMIATNKGYQRIEDIKNGDSVLTRMGFFKVVMTGKRKLQEIYKIILSNGRTLKGTADHPIYIRRTGFLPLCRVRKDFIPETIYDNVWHQRQLFLKALDSIDTQIPKGEATGFITDRMQIILKQESDIFTKKSGRNNMERYPKGLLSITKTAIPLTTISRTLHACQNQNINQCIQNNTMNRIKKKQESILRKSALLPNNGMHPKKVGNGIDNTAKKHGNKGNQLKENATIVGNAFLTLQEENHQGSVPINASQHGDERIELMTKQGYANGAKKNSRSIDIQRQRPVHVVAVQKCDGRQDVYNISVDKIHEYYANDILVSNCDALRYAMYTHANATKDSYFKLG